MDSMMSRVWESIPDELLDQVFFFISDLTGCTKSFGPAPIYPFELFSQLNSEQRKLIIWMRKMHYLEEFNKDE